MLVNEGDVIKFHQTLDSDLKEIHYCAERLEDDFNDSGADESSRQLKAKWQAMLASTACESGWLKAAADIPLEFSAGHAGVWVVKYRGVDELGNQAQTVQSKVLLFFHRHTIEMIKKLADIGPILAGSPEISRSLVNALQIEYLRRSLPSKYERDLVETEALQTKLLSLQQDYPLNIGVNKSSDLDFLFALTPNRKIYAQGSLSRNIELHDAETGHLLRTLEVEHHADALAFSRDGALIASVEGLTSKVLKVQAVDTGERVQSIGIKKEGARSLAFDQAHRHVASGFVDGTVGIWDINQALLTRDFQAHNAAVNFSEFVDGENLLVTASVNGEVKIWDTETWEQRFSGSTHAHRVSSLVSLPDASLAMADQTGRSIEILDPVAGKVLGSWNTGESPVLSLSVNMGGTKLFSVHEGGQMKVWNLATTSPEKVIGIGKQAEQLQITADDEHIFTYSWLGFFEIRSIADLERSATLEKSANLDGPISLSAMSPDASLVAVADYTDTVYIWKTRSGQLSQTLNTGPGVHTILFSPDGRLFIAGSLMQIKVWDSQTGTQLQDIDLNFDLGSRLTVTHDSRVLVSGSRFGNLKWFDLNTGNLLRTIKAHDEAISELAVSGDDSMLLSATTDLLKAWDLHTAVLIKDFGKQADAIRSLAFSGDQKSFMTTNPWGQISIWNLASGDLIKDFKRKNAIDSRGRIPATFAFGDRFVFSNSKSGLSLWDSETGSLVKTFADRVGSWSVNEHEKKLTFFTTDFRIYSFDLDAKNLTEKLCRISGRFLEQEIKEKAGDICRQQAASH